MDDATYKGHLPNQLLDNPRYILPDFRTNEEYLDVKDQPYEAVKLEHPKEIEDAVGILGIKQEFIKVEDYPCETLKLEFEPEILPITVLKEDLLDIKEEPGILYDGGLAGDDSVQCKADNIEINLRDGSDEDLTSLCEEETVCNNAVLHNTASPDSGMPLSLNVKHTLLSDCRIPSVHQFSPDTVLKGMYKKKKTSTVPITELPLRLQEVIKTHKPVLQYDIFNTSCKTLACNEDKLNICDTCYKCFSTSGSLKRHIKIHAGYKPYTCDICHKCFSELSHLKMHIRTHTGNKPYTCDTCHKCFIQLSSLKKHIRIHTGQKPYACVTCQKSFSDLSNLVTHTSTHTGRKPYTCDTCHKCFSLLASLNKHIRIHTGYKPYTCDTCHKHFSDLSNLNKHTRTHTGSKPYSCDTCHKCFNQSSSLKKHLRIHTGNKPYTCDICHKYFRNLSNLKTHTRIHTGIKPYTCDACHKCFNQISNLKRHIKNH